MQRIIDHSTGTTVCLREGLCANPGDPVAQRSSRIQQGKAQHLLLMTFTRNILLKAYPSF
jgi:hypothetical protein